MRQFSCFLLLGLLSACGSSLLPDPETEDRPPNIVLLVADDLGWTDLGAYGSTYYETPYIDSLAREGLKFSAAYANPNCAPTRAALMTGRYSPRTGIYTVGSGDRGLDEFRLLRAVENKTTLALDEVTFAERLQAAGYRTAQMGKWHLGEGPNRPEAQGFDVSIAGNASGSPRGGYFSPFKNPQLPDGPEGEHLTDRLAAEAVEFITANQDQPFLLYLPFYSVHTPIQAKPELTEKYAAKTTVAGHRNPKYAAMIETLDSAVGRVLGALDDLALADNTVVMFYSDNGGLGGYARAGVDAREVTDNAPLRGGKGMLYEGGVRVPLIVRWPGVTPPSATAIDPVMCVDFFPTLLEIAGVRPGGDREIDGRSFLSVIRTGRSLEPRPPIYWHFPGYLQGNAAVGAWRTTPAGAIRVDDYKLIEFFETGETELYNLEDDISERNDLARAEPAKAAELQQQLSDWRARLNAPMPQPK